MNKTDPGADLYGRTFACECGRTHTVEPAHAVYRADAMDRIPGLCAGATAGRSAAVLMDVRTADVAGRELARTLRAAGWRAAEYVVPDPAPGRSPVCDDATRDALRGVVGPADILLGAGSGVVSDLVKWLAFERARPFIAFATAASMNGYTSANVAPTVAGVKTLVRARPPVAVASTPAVIESAPWRLTASGLGDLLAKGVSSADWRLNHEVFGDFYCPRSVGLIGDIEPLYFEHPERVKAREAEAIGAVFHALLLTGVAMTLAESSAPSSGGEHMIGHTLDMMSSVDGREHDLHGRQVGVGTIIAAELYRRVLAVEAPEFAAPPSGVDRAFWRGLSDEVAGHYAEKAGRHRAAAAALARGTAWDDLRGVLAPMVRPPEAVRDCLRRADAAWRAEDIACPRPRLLAAVLHAHEIRSRFTVLDLAWLLGILPAAAAEIVEEWA